MKIVIYKEYGFHSGIKIGEFVSKTDKSISFKDNDRIPAKYKAFGKRIMQPESDLCKIVDLELNKDKINDFLTADRDIRLKITELEKQQKELEEKLFSELI